METIKLADKNCKVDFKSQQLTFLDSRFYTVEDGGYVPSVTAILDCYPKTAEYYVWLKKMGEDADTIRDEAGRRGSKIHDITERYDAGEEIKLLNENGYLDFTINEWAMVGRYAEFIERYSPKIFASEMNIVSKKLGFAGTLDRIITIGEKRYLVDIKTSNSIYPSYWLQLAAYEQLLIDANGYNPVDEVAILWLNAKTRTEKEFQGKGWQFLPKDDTTNDWKLFQATHILWKAQNEDVTPRQSSYKLSFKKSI